MYNVESHYQLSVSYLQSLTCQDALHLEREREWEETTKTISDIDHEWEKDQLHKMSSRLPESL